MQYLSNFEGEEFDGNFYARGEGAKVTEETQKTMDAMVILGRFTAIEDGDPKVPATGGPLDHDGNGKPGGSNPAEPVSLSGKNKAELLAIAKDEGVTVTEDATNSQIVEAIEAKRAA